VGEAVLRYFRLRPVNGRGELIVILQQSQRAFEASEIFAAEAAPTDLGGFGSRL